MVTFARYTSLAYDIAKSRGAQLSGQGTQQANRQFVSQLAELYNENNHSEATEQQARAFLEDAIDVA